VTDEELMQRFSKGEYEAFEVLYQRHKGGLYRYFLRQVNEQSKAEDLFQDIWSQVIASASRYSEKAKFTTWLYTMAKNKLVDHIRHVKVVTKVIDEQCDWQESDVELNVKQSQVNQTEKSFESSHQADAIKHCVGKLPQHQLDCFLLKEEAGMQISDIAEMMNSGLEATKSRLRYAYKNLRECLQHKLGEQNVTSIVDDVREQSA
jgi:RNA polymerase sigma-70 factor (ECF subfamily)